MWGGALGNAIFFFVAGYCLSTKASGHFGTWLKDRIIRVYFPFVLVQTVLVLIGFYSVDLNNVVELFVWPYITAWFICAILLFYVAFYFLSKATESKLRYFLIASIAVYLVTYFLILDLRSFVVENGWFKYIYYFITMQAGYLAKRTNYVEKKRIRRISWSVLTFISLFVHFGFKLLMRRIQLLSVLQFVVQASTLTFALCVFMFLSNFENRIKMMQNTAPGKLIRLVSLSTLEIYLLNEPMIVFLDTLDIGFPLNIVCTVGLIFASGIILHKLIDIIKVYLFELGGI